LTTLGGVKHRDAYLALLSPSLWERTLAKLVEEGILKLLDARGARVVDDAPLPYVRLEITRGKSGLIAHCTGVWFDVRPLVGPEGEEDYYLPVLGASEGASGPTMEHELLHLRDMLALLERDPSYSQRALKLGINSISAPYQIGKSVDLELFKIFAMEPQAYRLEFSLGETWIDVPCGDRELRYQCASAEELVSMRLADYVETLERKYLEKFPGHEAAIRKAMRRGTNLHGRALFGPQAYERVQQVNALTAWKVKAQLGVTLVR
jgi:hypothetical protein